MVDEIAIGSWQPNERLAAAMAMPFDFRSGNYHFDEEQKLVFAYMNANEFTIVAMALRGVPSKLIAAGFGVSREAIDKRLRPLGLKNAPSVHGRPPKAPKGKLVKSRKSRNFTTETYQVGSTIEVWQRRGGSLKLVSRKDQMPAP